MSAQQDDTADSLQPAWRQPVPRRRSKVRRARSLAPKAIAAGLRGTGRSVTGVLGRLRIHRRWITLPLLAAVGYGVLQLFSSYQFFVYGAEIVGNDRVPAEAIYAASQVDEKSIFWIHRRKVAERVEAIPGIGSADVHVRLPNQVQIEVHERIPTLVWQAGETAIWVDGYGETVPIAGAAPELTLIDVDSSAADENGKLRRQLVENIGALHNQRPELMNIYYGPKEGLYFRAPEGWTVYLGTDGGVPEKLALLESMRPSIAAQRVPPSIVDLRIRGTAFLRSITP